MFKAQLELQEKTFVPPHPTGSMVGEEVLKGAGEDVPASRGGGRHEEEEAERHMKVVQEVNKDF